MSQFNAETLNKETDLNVRIVPTPELGADVTCCIAEMTAEEQDDRLWIPWHKYKEKTKQDDNRRLRAFVVAACLCDESRNFIYDVPQIETVAEKWSKKSGKAVARLFTAADYLNAISPGEIEEIEKN